MTAAEWKTEYDVVTTLRAARTRGAAAGRGQRPRRHPRRGRASSSPHIAFNLLEGFDDVADLGPERGRLPRAAEGPVHRAATRAASCSARDKAIAKKLLAYHRIPVADFVVFPRGARGAAAASGCSFPLIVKSLTLDASIGISQASVVEDEDKLVERVRFIHEPIGTDALVERYIEGRELYVGVLGNQRAAGAAGLGAAVRRRCPRTSGKIATERLKWSLAYQKKHGIDSGAAQDIAPEVMARIQETLQARLPQPHALGLRPHRPAPGPRRARPT